MGDIKGHLAPCWVVSYVPVCKRGSNDYSPGLEWVNDCHDKGGRVVNDNHNEESKRGDNKDPNMEAKAPGGKTSKWDLIQPRIIMMQGRH